MKSLFVWCDLTGRVYTDPNATLLHVRFVSTCGSDKFDVLSSESPKFLFVQVWSVLRWEMVKSSRVEPNRTELSWAV